MFDKAGGRNTVLMDALSRRVPYVSDRPTIIFGADVTHPQPGEDSSPSIAAVCSPLSLVTACFVTHRFHLGNLSILFAICKMVFPFVNKGLKLDF